LAGAYERLVEPIPSCCFLLKHRITAGEPTKSKFGGDSSISGRAILQSKEFAMRGTALKAFDRSEVKLADQLEKDIATLTPRRPPALPGDEPRNYAPPESRAVPLPDYVAHRDGVSEIGKLSAEAIIREYEAAAREIEAVGQETARRCEAIAASVAGMLEDVKTTAAHFRSEAKRIFNDIESCSIITEEVRTTCDALKKKIVE
jgi:hypothetical protein